MGYRNDYINVIVDLNYKFDLSVIDKFVTEHRAWLDECYLAKKFLCSGVKNPRTGGVIIALVPELEELKQLLTQDPYAINNVAEYTITEFKPSKCHPDFIS
ncbi:MAG: hypothetical protein QG673_853, partial [Pseudomonadota bacterium]|nr:hypothetical protein [Pseudomonadota bacterium]